MTPADAKDWWLAAAALSSAFIPSAQAQDKTAAVPEKAGVVSGVQPGVKSTTNERVIYVGSDAYRGEKFVTDAKGSLHILFMDQSSMTLGPNSELTIDEFVYDPNAKKGKIGVSLASGLLRVVGGQISKSNETTVKTASGTIGIRGGITMAQVSGGQTNAHFVFGQLMRMSDNNGNTGTITRPGFGTSTSGNGLTDPVRTSMQEMGILTGQFSAQPGDGGTPSSGAPAGQLLSTGDRPSGAQSPSDTLSGDRLDNQTSTMLQSNPSSTDLRTLGGTTQEAAQNTTRQTIPPVPVS